MSAKTRILKTIVLLLLASAVALFSPHITRAADTYEVITPEKMETSSKVKAEKYGTWFFYDQVTNSINPNAGSFVFGPAGTTGKGSLQFSVTGSQKRGVGTYRFANTPLKDFEMIRYSTYDVSSTNSVGRSPAFVLNVSFNGQDTNQGYLMCLERDNVSSPQSQNMWLGWEAAASFSMIRYSGTYWPGTTIAGSTPRSWGEVVAAYPNAKIRKSDGFFGMVVGEPYPEGFTAYVGWFYIKTPAGVAQFEFEPSKATCLNGGWRLSQNPVFKDQTECINYVRN